MKTTLESVRCLAFFLCTAGTLRAQTTWHVNSAAAAGGNGLSWASAFDSIDDALNSSVLGDSVWVREGIYRPALRQDPQDPRSARFLIPQGIHFMGGFDGTEMTLLQRANHFERTILSGDLGLLGNVSDNAYNVVLLNFPNGTPPDFTYVDGFQIRDGNGIAAGGSGTGAGIHSVNTALVLSNCFIRDNASERGGGLYAQPGIAIVSRCTFEDNLAVVSGGAVAGQILLIRMSHCVLRGNQAGAKGGAIFQNSTLGGLESQAVLLGNCVMFDNRAPKGGAVFVGGNNVASSGKVTLLDCTIAFNSATQRGGGLRAVTSVANPGIAILRNCIVWGNQAPIGPNLDGRVQPEYSCIQGAAWTGAGNIHDAPRFLNVPMRNLRLQAGSPANDAGLNSDLPNDWTDIDGDGMTGEVVPTDLDGNIRIVDDVLVGPPNQAIVDMGAYERQ